jgi:hypothetical protein
MPGILRAGYLAEPDFDRHAAAVDACINLRFPAAGETSGIAIRLMGLAKPVLVTAGPETSRFPESVCVRIDSGLPEEEMLARAIGLRAAGHILEHHSLERAADMYWQVLEACYDE